MFNFYNNVPLGLATLPDFPNPFEATELPADDTSFFQQISSDPSTITQVAGSTIPNVNTTTSGLQVNPNNLQIERKL